MNWYKENITKIAANKAELLTRELSQFVFNKLKRGEESFCINITDMGVPYLSLLSCDTYLAEIASAKTVIKANYIPKLKKLGLFVYLHENITPSIYSELYQQIQLALRHEIEHLFADRQSLIEESGLQQEQSLYSNAKNFIRYLSNPIETAANVSSFYYIAKKNKKPLIGIIEDYLKRVKLWMATKFGMNFNDIDKMISMVAGIWLDYARKRFPKAVL